MVETSLLLLLSIDEVEVEDMQNSNVAEAVQKAFTQASSSKGPI